jgi:HAD superfamily hydrolase (TIGR01457 family)
MAVLADRYDAFLFDLDGVLYRGNEPVGAAPEAVGRLRSMGRRIAFVTNNSTRTPDAVVRRLREVGIEAEVAEVETSALATADLLAARGTRNAFVVGEQGVVDALLARGVSVLEGEPDGAEVVVVGLDRDVTYAKLRTASLLVERGAILVATNADASMPAPDGNWPGAGALLAAIEATTGIRAEVVGKPNAPLLQAALGRAGGGRPLLIGDRLDTDIAGAVRLGWDSLLVLTGVTAREDLEGASAVPTYVGDDLSVLFAPIAEAS